MINKQARRIADFFNSRVENFGYSLDALDYGKKRSQDLKFAAMTDVIPLNGLSVLDVGCGFADLADYLKGKGCEVDYTGFDISEKMIETARYRHPGLKLEIRNIMENPPEKKYDVVLSTGAFYLLKEDAENVMQEMITSMFNLANKALAFTTISSWAPVQSEDEFNADPLQTMAFCRTLSKKLVLKHDYHPGDFAIYMYKD